MTSTDRTKSVLLIAIFTAVWIGVGVSIGLFGWLDTWSALIHERNVVKQPFYDMWTVKTALDSVAMGLNPQLENPAHPFGIVMNYPSVWLPIGDFFGLDDNSNFIAFTTAVIVAFLLCGAGLLWNFPSIWLLCSLLSGAVFFAIERGNNDLVVFSSLFLAAAAPPFIRIIPVLAAVLLKLYPVLVLPWFVRTLRELAIVLVGCGAIVWYLWPEIGDIVSGNNARDFLTYGNFTVSLHLYEAFGVMVPTLTVSIVLAVTAAICGANLSHHCDTDPAKRSEFHERLFYIGSCLFVGTFLLGSSNVYRLIVLIFCVPHVLSLRNRPLSFGAISSLLLVMNSIHLYWLFGLPGSMAKVVLEVFLFLFLSTTLMHLMRRDLPWLDRIMNRAAMYASERPTARTCLGTHATKD